MEKRSKEVVINNATNISNLDDDSLDRLVDNLEETAFRQREQRWSNRSREEKEQLARNWFDSHGDTTVSFF